MTTLREIENMPAATIKEQTAALVADFRKQVAEVAFDIAGGSEAGTAELDAAAGKLAPLQLEDLFERFLRARYDAKVRDEKMSEQGQTISSQNAGITSLTQQLEEMKTKRDEAVNVANQIDDRRKQEATEFQATINAADELKARLEEENRQIRQELKDALKLAKDRRAALADIMQFAGQLNSRVSPLLAAE